MGVMVKRSGTTGTWAVAGGIAALVAVVVSLGCPMDIHARERTVWEGDDGSTLAVDGWVAADLRAFPRTETGYGRSWNVDPLLSSARLGLRYRPTRNLLTHVDGEFSEANPDVQEAWFEYGPWELLRLRAGRVKVPFGAYPQLSLPDYALISVPMAFGNQKDFRDSGFMVWGSWEEGYLSYWAAVVTGSRDLMVEVNDKPDYVGRVQLHLPASSGAWLKGASLGGSFSWGEGPIRHGFRGRTMGGHTFAEPPTIRGEQQRWGLEATWDTPLFRVSGEYVTSSQDREGVTYTQKAAPYGQVGDLNPYETKGWHAEALLRLSRLVGCAMGPEFELAGRYERLEFEDGVRDVTNEAGAIEERAPLSDSGVHGVTAGLAVRFNAHVKLALVWQGLYFDDPTRAPDAEDAAPAAGAVDGAEAAAPAKSWYHQFFMRAQFEL